MKNISSIIIDDEPKNIQLLQKMLEAHCPSVNVVATASDPKKALQLLKEKEPQLLFLDIEMPHLNGFDLLKNLGSLNMEVIFVTAYSQYAIEAFEYHATGYITKPINTEKLVAAVNEAAKRIKDKTVNKNLLTLLEQYSQNAITDKIPLSTSNGLLFVRIADIIYCESSGNYTFFYMNDERKIVVSRQLGEYEKLLPENNFVRIHDKYIINLAFIKEYIKGSGGEVLLENGKEIPVASRRKEDFLARFEKWIKRKG